MGKRKKWLRQRNIHHNAMYRWIKKKEQWLKLSREDMRQSHIKINRFRGLFHDQEIKVLSSITSRRLEGLRVSYMWITCKMMEQVKKDQPLLYVMNPNKYNFKKGWVTRFCKRHNLSVQRRKNKKKKQCMRDYISFRTIIGG